MAISSKQEPKGCRWIYGDPLKSGWHYCQKAQAENSSYCEEHHELAHISEGSPQHKRAMKNYNFNAKVTGGAMAMHSSPSFIEVKGN